MKSIKIELSTESCKQAVEDLKRYQKEIRPKMEEVCRKLAEIGKETAQRIFNEAAANVAEGNGGVQVTTVPIENGYKIVASGEDVYFIEFGTGNSAGMFYGDGLPVTSVPVYPGSYSETHAGIYAEKHYWFYRGQIMSSTDTYMPMYYAGKAIRENERRVIREVFK